MKKSLFIALLACATLALVGCDNGAANESGANGGSGAAVTGVTVTPATLNLTLGEEYRLACTLTPSGAKGTVTWESSNPEVVTVTSMGRVKAVGYGSANVTATCGEYKGVCAVTVTTYYESLQFTNAFFADMDTLAYGGKVDTVKSGSGETFKAYLAEATMYVFSDGFYVNNSYMLDGTVKGTYITVKAPMYYTSNYLNDGKGGIIFSLGNWYVADIDSLYPLVGKPTQFDEANYKLAMNDAGPALAKQDNNAFKTAAEAAGKCFTGTEIKTYEFHAATEEGYSQDAYYSSYIPDGMILRGQFTMMGKEGASEVMYGLDYSYFEFLPLDDMNYYWGCDWRVDENGVFSWGDKDIKWLDMIVYEYGEKPAAEAQRMMEPMPVTVMSIDHPEMVERLENQLKQYNTLVVKK
jgi:hypothetical protein